MFRALIFQRSNLDQGAIASVDILKATPYEDLTQKASSSFTCYEVPSNVQVNDIIRFYDTKGKFVYWGMINAIEDKTIKCSQFVSIFNDNLLIVPQTSEAQIFNYNNFPVSMIMAFYLEAKIQGHASIENTVEVGQLPVYTSLTDIDVANNYKSIVTYPVDEGEERVPYPTENETINLENYIYDSFNNYSRIVRPFWSFLESDFLITDSGDYITTEGGDKLLVTRKSSEPLIVLLITYPNGVIEAPNGDVIDFSQKTLFDTHENISNVSIVKSDEEVNTVYVYNKEGTTLRGAYTVKNDGTIVQITDSTSVTNRLGSNKTQFIFDDENEVLDLVKSKLPSLQYNHKITFDIKFDDKIKFDDFILGQPIKFYDSQGNRIFNSILTAWKFNVEENSDVVKSATFTLGKVRTNLTSKILKNANGR